MVTGKKESMKWPCVYWNSHSLKTGKQICKSSFIIMISRRSRINMSAIMLTHSYFFSKIKLGAHWSASQRTQWGWAMRALLSDVKISTLTPPVAVEIWWAKEGNGSKKRWRLLSRFWVKRKYKVYPQQKWQPLSNHSSTIGNALEVPWLYLQWGAFTYQRGNYLW